ncbi:intermembrane transport protein PqiB [Endozoicomonas arenosclerae]|uniref:PqiB family protein n=1 Tax=Endozoicomonas arenosclerae TaxID=1633495 RepID=UPI000781DB88|nr:MlaD family protein [Endozoicomonas arenosclerae]
MSDEKLAAKAALKERRRIPAIWLLPFIALMIVIFLIWRTLYQNGLEVHVHFDSAKGMKVGKTEVRYNGLAIGKVARMTMTENLEGVDVELEMDRQMEEYLREYSQFWLVQPQLSVAGVSGLDTLVSGNYIAFKPSEKGEKKLSFSALKAPPAPGIEEGGLSLVLQADELSSVQEGSPVYYRRLKIGEVTRYSLSPDDQRVDIHVYIKPAFSHLVRKNTRFWNAGGVDISGSLTNLKVRTQSLISMIQGGVALYTPEWEEEEPEATDGSRFSLYTDYDAAEAGISISIEFPMDVALGQEKSKILFHGMEVGVIKDTSFNDDYTAIVAEAVIRPEAKPILVKGARFWVVAPQINLKGITGLETLLGGRYIAMDVSQVDMKKAEPATQFAGLGQKPPASPSSPGLHLELRADALEGLSQGSPVLYRKLPVGEVESYTLSNEGVVIKVLISPKYQHLVNKSTVFWNISGVTLEGGLQGFKVRAGTLNSMLSGGIAFKTPDLNAARVSNKTRFVLYDDITRASETGKVIDIQFESADGLQVGTRMKYKGLEMGRVTELNLDKDKKSIQAKVLLKENAGWLARSGSRFWLVKPKLGLTNTAHLETLLTGLYIGVSPSASARVTEQETFVADSRAPDDQPRSSGLRIQLISSQLGSIKPGNPVYYREIPVGTVTGFRLGSPADKVIIFLNIEDHYASLVTEKSRFWNASGVDINFGLFSGAKIRTESLEALLAGGIAFATPEQAEPAAAETSFELADKPKPEWLKWAPGIVLP